MKTLLLFFCLIFSYSTLSQSIQIVEATSAAAPGGITVNVKAISFNGADYLSNSHSIQDNTITLKVCYSFSQVLPVLQFNNDFFIPYNSTEDCTIIVEVYNSVSPTICDYFSLGDTETISFLDNDTFLQAKNELTFYPNPSNGILEVNSNLDNLNHTIYDNLGKIVAEKATNSKQLDVSNLDAGIYYIKSTNSTKSYTSKLVIQ